MKLLLPRYKYGRNNREENFQHMQRLRPGDRRRWHRRLRYRPRDDHETPEYENGYRGEGECPSNASNRTQQWSGTRRHLLHAWKYEGKL